ncbi:MAG TPA: hypothetical protein VMF87_14605 [Streptosporangiaceae bacterium]|nr:hypothetical protein [Streptosporangiaceae bacterium]
MSVATDIVLGVVVLALLIYRQVVARPVTTRGLQIVGILAIIGVLQTVQYFDKYHSSDGTYAALGGSLVLAAIFGALRSATVRIWIQDGQAWQKGNWVTGALWVVALAAHLGYDALVARGHGHGAPSVGDATVVLYLAVSLGIQRVIIQQRANRVLPGGGAPGPGAPGPSGFGTAPR